jgi:microcystin degradation protein MlrC
VLEVPEARDLALVVTERRVPPIGPELFRSVGIEPTAMQVLAVKTRAHYWQPYPFVQALIETETPGLASSDLRGLPYRRLRRPRYPLDPVMAWP